MQRIERALLTLTACGGLLALLAAGETAGSGRPALADTVKARRASHVYSSPADQSRVVARVRAGDKIQVLQRKNRWFKVRVKGRTGWITRKSVARLRQAEARGRGRRRPAPRGRDRIAVRSTSDVARELQARDPGARDELKQRAIVRQRILRRELELARAEELALVQAEQREAAKRARPAPAARVEPMVEAEPESVAIDGIAGEPAVTPVAVRTRGRSTRPLGAQGAAGTASDRLDAADSMDQAAGAADDDEIPDGVIVRESDRIPRPDRRAPGEGEGKLVRAPDPGESDPREPDAIDSGSGAIARDSVARDDRENPLAPSQQPAGDTGATSGDKPDADPRERQTVVVVAGQARLYELPSARSEPVERAAVGSELVVLGRSGAWIKVQNQRGVAGWIPDAKVRGPRRPAPVARLTKRASAGVGYSAIGQSFASSSDDPRGAYTLSSGAAVLGLDGELVHASSDRWRLAGDLAYRLIIAAPGIRYTDPESMASVDIGFKRHLVNLGARAGYVLGGDMGMVAYGRVGFRYDNFRINDVSNFDRNLARLPSEVLTGVTVGALLDVPRLGGAWSARVRVNALPLLASRQQTTGLEDGASSKTFAAWGGALVEYAWDETYKLSAAYEYAYARTRWNGAVETSMRPHMADSARRKDSAHQLFLGVGRSF